MIYDFFNNLLQLSLEAAPWLVFGLALAGFLKTILTDSKLQHWLSQDNWISPVLAAFIGAPLPLCSCGVLPVAIGLKQNGASKATTVSFLVSTPENGIDSISMTYALLGPIMAIVRPVAGISLAICAGLLTYFWREDESDVQTHKSKSDEQNKSQPTICCSSQTKAEKVQPVTTTCCASESSETKAATSSCCASQSSETKTATSSCCASEKSSTKNDIISGLRYSFGKLWLDIYGWLIIGIVVAAIVQTFVPPEVLVELGYSWMGLFAMLIIGIPIYICATASTPIAAALIASGLSPGAALVFLLAGPATNLGSIGLLKQELGNRSLMIYLATISVGSLLMGYALNQVLLSTGWQIIPNVGHEHSMLPVWLQAASLLLLILLTIFKIKPTQA